MNRRPGVKKICFAVGCILILCSLSLLGWQQISMVRAEKKSSDYVETLRTLLPEPESAVPEKKSSNEMPVLSVDGVDFVGILELPEYDCVLPVCGDWNETLWYPSCYVGSIYDSSMKIGATTQKGQFGFYRTIGVGDAIYFTDMTGNRYAYKVTDILYRKHADAQTLGQKESDLTLFLKNLYAFEYVMIYCKTMT